MRHPSSVLALALLSILLPAGADAASDFIEAVPAATLLIPVFQVDVSDQACAQRDGFNTLFSVNNESSDPTVAHVTMWTDQAVPVMTFDIYLTGFDIQTVSLQKIFCDGILPQTGSAVSNHSLLSGPPAEFADCNNTPIAGEGPNYDNPFSADMVRLLKEWFTGRPSSELGTCAGSGQLGPDIAIGYLTIDQVENCTALVPSDPLYYDPAGPLGFDNVLWGDYFYQDVANAFAQGFPAVHIEALDEGAVADGEHTFYGRYHSLLANNRREPLPTTFKARFALGGVFDRTTFNVWREANNDSISYDCADGGPGWWPLDQANTSGVGPLVVFNEQEESFVPASARAHPEPAGSYFRNAANAVPIGDGASTHPESLPTGGFAFGAVYANFQSSSSVYGTGITQAWVTTRIQASGLYSVGLDALQLDTAANPIAINP